MLFFRKQKFQGRDTMFYEVLANKNPFILQKNNFVFKVILSTNENEQQELGLTRKTTMLFEWTVTTNYKNQSHQWKQMFFITRQVDIDPPQTSLVISSLLRREQNSTVGKGLITQDNFSCILSLSLFWFFVAKLHETPFGPRLTTPGNRICLQETSTSHTSAEKSGPDCTMC